MPKIRELFKSKLLEYTTGLCRCNVDRTIAERNASILMDFWDTVQMEKAIDDLYASEVKEVK